MGMSMTVKQGETITTNTWDPRIVGRLWREAQRLAEDPYLSPVVRYAYAAKAEVLADILAHLRPEAKDLWKGAALAMFLLRLELAQNIRYCTDDS